MSAKKTPLPHQIVNFSKKTDPTTHYEQVMQSEEFPVRPGQPDCDYFMKTGDCKYRSACRYNHPVSRDSKLRLPLLSSKGLYSKSKNPELPDSFTGNPRKSGASYHHPRDRISTSSPSSLNESGLPLRPGSKICRNYELQ
ncbi:hypothetical protein SOVF_197960, partial [Spinacia oleracea]